MRAWRIVKASHAAGAMTGEGARLYGGRWNSPGRAVVYAASSLSLAALEMLVGLDDYGLLVADYSCLHLDFDLSLVERVPVESLPPDWRRFEHPALAALGDAWIASLRAAVLEVPSAVIPQESNFCINPAHPDFPQITVGKLQPFPFDGRLIKR